MVSKCKIWLKKLRQFWPRPREGWPRPRSWPCPLLDSLTSLAGYEGMQSPVCICYAVATCEIGPPIIISAFVDVRMK